MVRICLNGDWMQFCHQTEEIPTNICDTSEIIYNIMIISSGSSWVIDLMLIVMNMLLSYFFKSVFMATNVVMICFRNRQVICKLLYDQCILNIFLIINFDLNHKSTIVLIGVISKQFPEYSICCYFWFVFCWVFF